MSEADLQASVIELARWRGWRVAHFDAARMRSGVWGTPVVADGAGFPDLCMVRGDRLVWSEMKSGRGRLRPEQEQWLAALRNTPTEVYLWRPEDWTSGEIRRILW